MSLNNIDEDLITTNVTRWIDLNDQIKNFQDEIKKIKQSKLICESQIIQSMKQNQLDNLNLANDKKIELKIVESKKSLTPNQFRDELKKCNSPDNSKDQVVFLVKELYEKINNQPSKKVEKLIYKG